MVLASEISKLRNKTKEKIRYLELKIVLLENFHPNKSRKKIQKVIIIRYDFLINSKLSQRFYDAETSERDPEFVKLLNNSNKIYTALSEGTLQQTKQLMPPHYTFHDKVSTFQITTGDHLINVCFLFRRVEST